MRDCLRATFNSSRAHTNELKCIHKLSSKPRAAVVCRWQSHGILQIALTRRIKAALSARVYDRLFFLQYALTRAVCRIAHNLFIQLKKANERLT